MQKVLIVGAGKSSSYLIDFMLQNAKRKWQVIVMDSNSELVHEKINNHPKGIPAVIDLFDDEGRRGLIQQCDLVISLLPSHLHIVVAKDCLEFKKNLILPSYAPPEILALDEAVKKAGLLFMCEMGLDPGIDHMSAANLVDGIHRIAGKVTSFRSYCGGLIAPESEDNPWQYKIAWNPQNIVGAGKSGAAWREKGKDYEVDYTEVFKNTNKVEIPSIGTLSAYPNRDSLKYASLYHLDGVKTIVRATLRYPGFIKAWDYMIQAHLTDDQDEIEAQEATYSSWLSQKAGLTDGDQLKKDFADKYNVDNKSLKLIEWLGVFETRLINAEGKKSSFQILQNLLERKWKMRPIDKDMVIMQHIIDYERRGVMNRVTSTLIVKGENRMYSAMAKTVGLPMAILGKKILDNTLNLSHLTGVQIPTMREVYAPILRELAKAGIEFEERFD